MTESFYLTDDERKALKEGLRRYLDKIANKLWADKRFDNIDFSDVKTNTFIGIKPEDRAAFKAEVAKVSTALKTMDFEKYAVPGPMLTGFSRLQAQQLEEIKLVKENFDLSVFAGAQGPLSGSGCRKDIDD